MMSTNTRSGWWSAIFASASKPSSARMTVQPACSRKISALRRMVFESSITITLTPDNGILLCQLDAPSPSGNSSGAPIRRPHSSCVKSATVQANCLEHKPCRNRHAGPKTRKMQHSRQVFARGTAAAGRQASAAVPATNGATGAQPPTGPGTSGRRDCRSRRRSRSPSRSRKRRNSALSDGGTCIPTSTRP